MFKKTAIVAGFGLFLSMSASAEFQWEAGASYLTGDIESDDLNEDADIDVFSVNGSWFFAPVDTSKGALAEAAFLDRASRVDLDFSNGELDFDSDDADISAYGINARWVFGRERRWLVEGGYRQDEVENEEIDSFNIGGGWYVFDNTLITAGYTYSDTDDFGDADTYSVEIEHYTDIEIGSIKLDAGYAYFDPGGNDDTDNWLGRVTYYPMSRLGVGGEWERIDSGSTDDNWSLFAEYFFNEQIAVSLEYTDIERTSGVSDLDGDAIVVGGRYRF